MVRYIIKRLFIGVVTIWALITITFFLIRIMPGSPFEADNLSQSAIEQLESTYGLDEPMWKQYILYMENLMHGDLGISYKKNVSVNTLIARGFPYTLSECHFYRSLLKLHRNRHFRSDGKLGFHGTGCPSGAYHAPGTAAFADHLHLYHHFLPELPRRGNRRCL